MNSRKRESLPYFVVGIIFLAAFTFGLRLHDLDKESLFMDELLQVSYYPRSFFQLISDASTMAQPPLDYWIGHVVYQISETDFAVRLPAAIFGTLSILLLTLLVADFCTWPVGILTGVIAALLPFNLYFSQEARPYSIAIFFFVAVLWALRLLFNGHKERQDSACLKKVENRLHLLIRVLVLILAATLFLFSRTLSPLVVTTFLAGILFALVGYTLLKEGYTKENKCRYIFLGFAILAIISALALYFPTFKKILSAASRYADPSLGIEKDDLVSVFRNFDISPMWRAYIAQTDPLGIPFLILLIFSPYFIWRAKYQNPIPLICLFLLPGAALLNLLVFQIKSPHMPFRPPYAIYVLPLTLLLSAISIQGIWNLTRQFPNSHWVRFCLLIAMSFGLFNMGYAAVQFKSFPKKPDWRGLAAYLSEAFQEDEVLVFDALSPYGKWEPTFYGFPRYYSGKSIRVSVGDIPFLADKMAHLSAEPVFILFQRREYFLTPDSKYPIMPGNRDMDKYYRNILSDPQLLTKTFTGFLIVRVDNPGGELAKDMYTLINRLLVHLPSNSKTVELNLAVAALSKSLGTGEWHHYLQISEKHIENTNKERWVGIKSHIHSISENKF